MSNAADMANDGEKFSLPYQRTDEDDEEKDKSDKAEESGTSALGSQRTVMQGGVKLELSGKKQDFTGARSDSAQHEQLTVSGIIETVKEWISAFVQSVKNFLYHIWNDQAPQEDVGEDVSVQDGKTQKEEERLTEEYRALKNLEELRNPEAFVKRQAEQETERNKEIQRLLRSGDMDQVVSLVTENGQKVMAKNSTLLTYYDRTGKIAPLNASDQERILHGDRSTRKL